MSEQRCNLQIFPRVKAGERVDDSTVRYMAHVREVANVCVALTEVRAKICAPLTATWHYAGNTKGKKIQKNRIRLPPLELSLGTTRAIQRVKK